MMEAAFLRFKKLKESGIIKKAARHNRREIQAELGADRTIDPKRIDLNQTLRGAAKADDVALAAKNLMQAAGVRPLRKDAVLGIEIVFSLPPNSAINDTAYFEDCTRWAAANFGGDKNILSADIHRDEAAPHCHVLILPLDGDNRMNGGAILGRLRFPDWQSLFYKNVAQGYGLIKPPARLAGNQKAATAKAVIQSLKDRDDPALASSIWPNCRLHIENDPAPFAVAMGLEIAKPAKQMRTMAQIFTSKGKGKAVEQPERLKLQKVKSIDFGSCAVHQSLCSVDFASPENREKQPAIELPVHRVREDELDVSFFDDEKGEFRPTQPPKQNAIKQSAKLWVHSALAKHPKFRQA